MLQIFNYNAGRGECIRIRFDRHNVLIDSGVSAFGVRLAEIGREIRAANEEIDVFVLTHVDADHIGGLLYHLRQGNRLPIHEVWMNHGKGNAGNTELSTRQNDEVYSLLMKYNISVLPAVAGMVRQIGKGIFRILAPEEELLHDFYAKQQERYTKQCRVLLKAQSDYGYSMEELWNKALPAGDTSLNNRASVVFEFLYDSQKMLFTGDAWAEDLCKTAGDYYDFIKLPHHGSARNLSEDWKKIQCRNFIVGTDGVHHPDKQTLAKLIRWNDTPTFYGSNAWWRSMLGEKEKSYERYFVEGEQCLWLMPGKN